MKDVEDNTIESSTLNLIGHNTRNERKSTNMVKKKPIDFDDFITFERFRNKKKKGKLEGDSSNIPEIDSEDSGDSEDKDNGYQNRRENSLGTNLRKRKPFKADGKYSYKQIYVDFTEEEVDLWF